MRSQMIRKSLIVNNYLNKHTKAAPLAVFRIFFGVMMFASILRFWANGWIEKLYIQPNFFFSYYGFEWVKPIGEFTYLFFIICGISALAVAIGLFYRIAIIAFFLSFTYIELMDKTTYLNHYYFISLLSFLLIFLPANAYFSADSYRKKIVWNEVPQWTIDSIKLLLGIVYFYAGLAKLNSDWLFNAMPLKIWLPSNYDIPLLGDFLHQEWLIYAFSWSGALYDLSIPFLLLYRKTRWFAFFLVVVFHLLTRVLFPIGMFPYIMIVSATIFLEAKYHERVISFFKLVGKQISIIASKAKQSVPSEDNAASQRSQDREKLPHPYSSSQPYLKKRFGVTGNKYNKILVSILTLFFIIQLLLPFRYLLYPGELFWTEEGFRFSWRVMLIEKAGYANFKVVNGKTGERFYVDNTDFLSSFQEKQMATQPDFILEYAHFLKNHFESQGHQNIEIYVESYVALNGRRSQPYIDPSVNLVEQTESFKHKDWILPFQGEIRGL